MKIKGIAAGLLIGLSVTASAGVIDTSIIRASIIKAGVVASGVVGNPFGGAVADFFTLNFNLGTIVPDTTETVTTSLTRASVSSITDANDRRGVQIGSGEVPFVGLDRVENLSQLSDTSSLAIAATDTLNVTPGTYVFSMGAGSGTANFSGTATGATGSLDADASNRTAKVLTITSSGTLIATAATAALTDIQWEDVSGKPNKAPGQYTSVGVESAPYHGAGVDGVRYSNRWNPRYVDSNNVVQNDSATGAAISNTTAKFVSANNSVSVFGANHVSQPSSTANSPTNQLTIAIYVTQSAWNTVPFGTKLAQKDNSGYSLGLSQTGQPSWTIRNEANTATGNGSSGSSLSTVIAEGEGFWLKSTFNAGAFTHSTSKQPHYVDPNAITDWSVLGSGTVTNSVVDINTTTSDLTVFGAAGGGLLGLQGRGYKFYLYKDSDTNASPDVTFDPADTTGWTLEGNAYISTPPLNPDGDGPAGLQVAAASTNVSRYSEQADNADWFNDDTIDADAAVAPDGTTTADRMNVAAVSGPHRNYEQYTGITASTAHTWSRFIKDDGAGFAQLRVYYAGNEWGAVTINTQSGVVTDTATGTNTTTTIVGSDVEIGPDGWFRPWIAFSNSSATSPVVYVETSDSGTPTRNSVTGQITFTPSAGDDLFIWGAQLEAGSYPTGYIETGPSAVARNADVETNSGFSLTTTSGHIEVSDMEAVDGETYLRIDDGTSNNYIRVYMNASSEVQLDVYSGGVAQAQMTSTTTFSPGDSVDIAFRVDTNDAALLIDQVEEATDTSVTLPATMDDVDIGNNAGTVTGVHDTQKIILYDTAKSNAELGAL